MTYEEAINTIKHGCIYRDKRGGIALQIAIKALEKQIPKKPKAIKGDFSIYYDCPYCRQYIATVSDGELCCGKKHIYCPVCGQRLLWDGDTE